MLSREAAIVSVGGLSIKEVDKVVSFLNIAAHFALMHCVAIYPTPSDKFSLDFIERFAIVTRTSPSDFLRTKRRTTLGR